MIRRLCLGLVFALFLATSAHAEMVSIAGDKVNMRSGPGEQHAILWEIRKGYPLKIIARQGKWLKVRDFENDTGWVYKPLVSREAHLVVNRPRVNIRSGPGEKYGLVGKAEYGVVLKTVQRKNGWVKVRHENGLSGWVLRTLLWGW